MQMEVETVAALLPEYKGRNKGALIHFKTTAEIIEGPSCRKKDVFICTLPEEKARVGGIYMLLRNGDRSCYYQIRKGIREGSKSSKLQNSYRVQFFQYLAAIIPSRLVREKKAAVLEAEAIKLPAGTSGKVAALIKGTGISGSFEKASVAGGRNFRVGFFGEGGNKDEDDVATDKSPYIHLPCGKALKEAYDAGQRHCYIRANFRAVHPLFLEVPDGYTSEEIANLGLDFLDHEKGWLPIDLEFRTKNDGLETLKLLLEGKEVLISLNLLDATDMPAHHIPGQVPKPVVQAGEEDIFQIQSGRILAPYAERSLIFYYQVRRLCIPKAFARHLGYLTTGSKVLYRVDGHMKKREDWKLYMSFPKGPHKGIWFDIYSVSTPGNGDEFPAFLYNILRDRKMFRKSPKENKAS